MMHTARRSLTALILVAGMVWIGGCSSDDDSSNNNTTNTSSIYLDIVPNSSFTFDRTTLDSLNNPIASTTHNYAVAFKGCGGLYQGAYTDWFYRIGTDGATLQKDTMYIRTNIGSLSGKSFTKEVQAYGMVYAIQEKLVNMIIANYPLATPPKLRGKNWDVIAMYMGDDGKSFDVGKEWVLDNGSTLNFTILGTTIPIEVSMKGKLEAKEEVIVVGTNNVKAWKTCLTVTLNMLGGLSTASMKLNTWFSDNPDGPIKVVQESTAITIPIVNQKIQIPGEMQILKTWTE
jgi:hypothetical protein